MKYCAVMIASILCCAPLFAQVENQTQQQLRGMSSRDILDCAFLSHMGGCKYDAWMLGYELGRRGNVPFLVRSYNGADAGQREVIILAMTRIRHNPDVAAFMRRVAFKQFWPDKLDTEPRWYALQYLAESCDQYALARLNGEHNFRDSYPVACMYWTDTIRTFGKCKYRPAIPHLIQSINTVACLNISDSAIKSLHDLLPGKCGHMESLSLDQVHDCFQRAARQAEASDVTRDDR